MMAPWALICTFFIVTHCLNSSHFCWPILAYSWALFLSSI